MTTFNLNKAFRILRRNYGCPGSDEITIKEIKSDYWKYKCLIEEQLCNNSFSFSTPRFTKICSGTYTTETRNIFVYSIFDRWVQVALKLELEKHLHFKDTVFSYRKGTNKVNALKYLLASNPKFLLAIDLKKFFESIDKEYLLGKLELAITDKDLFQLTKKSISHCENGLPLGNCISPLLANFYLTEIDESFPNNFSRYSDDMFFSIDNTSNIESIIEKISIILKENLMLELNREKIFIYQTPKLENIINEFPWIVNTEHRQLKLESIKSK